MKKRALVVYHRVDYDGLFSGMITRKFLEDAGYNITYLAYNYGEPLPPDINSYGEIYLVDISFTPDLMKKYAKRMTWIDHHATAINSSIENNYSWIVGNRVVGVAACELCWYYFFPNIQIPKIIQYLGAYDVWNKDKFDWENEVLPLQNALRASVGMSMDGVYPIFSDSIDNFNLDLLFEMGRLIKNYEDYGFKSAVKNYAFPVLVAGKYKGVAMLTHNFGSRIFSSVINDYDIYITVNRKNNQTTGQAPTYNLSMYSEPGRVPDFNIGEYLKSFNLGGGGHACAGGSVITEQQFLNLLGQGII